MATYIQGLTDYIPQIQPFTPDLNFYDKALTFKQSKYDAGKEQLNNLYGSLLNSDLSREDNIQARDKFFEIINQDIKRMSGLDLSKQQNVEMASNVFNQLLDDNYISHDMVFTKNWKSQISKGKALKNCVDTKDNKCGGQWWQGGDQLMQYNMQAFKEAGADEALNMSPEEYIPAQNVMKMAIDLAKEANLNVQFDQKNGGYITTYKNGKALKKPLSQLFTGVIGQDPKVKAYYNAQGKLSRLNYVSNNAERLGSKEAAEQDYIKTYAANLSTEMTTQRNIMQESLDQQKAKIEYNNKKIASTKRADLIERYQQENAAYNQEVNMYQQGLDYYDEQIAEIENAVINNEYKGYQIDSMLGSRMLNQSIDSSAEILANKDASVTMKADQYELASFNNKLATNKELLLIGAREQSHLRKLDYEYQLKDKYGEFNKNFEGQNNGQGYNYDNNYNISPVTGGTEINNENDPKGYDNFSETINESVVNYKSSQTDVLNDIITYSEGELASSNPNIQAEENLVNLGTSLLQTSLEEDKRTTFNEYVDDNDDYQEALTKKREERQKLLNQVNNAATTTDKFRILKENNILTRAALEELTNSQMDNLYNNVVTPFYKSTTSDNDYVKTVLHKNLEQVNLINATKESIASYNDGWNNVVHPQVVAKAKVSGNLDDIERAGIEALYKNGYVVSKEQFVTDLVAKNFDKEEAEDLYGDFEESDIKDLYRAIFDQSADLTTAMGFANLNGTNSSSAAPLQFDINAYDINNFGRNVAVSALKESLESQNNSYIYDIGDFKEEVPERDADKQAEFKEYANRLFTELANPKKGKTARLKFTGIVTPIAGSDANIIGYKFTPDPKWAEANWKRTDGDEVYEDDPSIRSLIMYVPKDKTNALYPRTIKTTPQEVSFTLNNEYKIDDTNYYKDVKVTGETGNYTATGYAYAGMDENNKPKFQYFKRDYTGTQSFNSVLDELIGETGRLTYIQKQGSAMDKKN